MPPSSVRIVTALLFLAGAAARLWNAATFPPMRGYDAYAHFGYLWFLAAEGRVPPATAGWEFFQPPLYYAFLLLPWTLLDAVDPIVRLRIGTAVVALASLLPARVVLRECRRRFPELPWIAPAAAAFVLFVPVHLYSAGFLGNEVFCAVLCAAAFGALLWTLRTPNAARAAALGLVLGAAMLAKFTAVVVVAAALGALAVQALRRGEPVAGVARVAAASVAMLLVCGWFYGRNALEYGNPFQMSREGAFLAQVENSQAQGRRGLAEYLLFDPGILYRPQWPRGTSVGADPATAPAYSALRHSIPTGLYANAWFDGFGGFALPLVTESEASRRAGQVLLTLGLVPTALLLVGLAAGLRAALRRRADDTTVAMLLATAAMAAVVVEGTRSVPTQAAVKATYLMPIAVPLAFWFATGLDVLWRRRARAAPAALAACAALAAAGVLVFAHGLAIDERGLSTEHPNPTATNLDGMVYAAAGWLAPARALFEESAAGGVALAHENLAALEFDDGRDRAALAHLDAALAAHRARLATANEHQLAYLRTTLAEVTNSRAVVLARLDRPKEAMAAAREARALDPSIPEAHYDVGLLLLSNGDGRAWSRRVFRAQRAFRAALALDPAFDQARLMLGVALVLGGDCAAGQRRIAEATSPSPRRHRAWPTRTGPGDQNAAVLDRRRRIAQYPERLDPDRVVEKCEATARGGDRGVSRGDRR